MPLTKLKSGSAREGGQWGCQGRRPSKQDHEEKTKLSPLRMYRHSLTMTNTVYVFMGAGDIQTYGTHLNVSCQTWQATSNRKAKWKLRHYKAKDLSI